MKKIKRNKTSGITLISLVVTIIVLLILAGISVQMISGNNGILQRATEAKQKTIIANETEKVKLAVTDAQIDAYKTGDRELTYDLLHDSIAEQFGNDITLNGIGPWTFNGKESTYIIEVSGDIKDINVALDRLKEYLLNKSKDTWFNEEDQLYIALDPINDADSSIHYITSEGSKDYIEYFNKIFVVTLENNIAKDVQLENKNAFIIRDTGDPVIKKIDATKYESWYEWANDIIDNNDIDIALWSDREELTLKEYIKEIHDNVNDIEKKIELYTVYSPSVISTMFFNNSYPYDLSSTEKITSNIIPGNAYYLFDLKW